MAAFQFEKKRELDICGRKYPCDISDVHMLEGVTRDFPRMLRAVQEFCNVSGRLNADAHDWRPTAPAAELVCEKAVSYTHLDVYKRQPQRIRFGVVPVDGDAR